MTNGSGSIMKTVQVIVAMIVLLATVFGVHASISSNYVTREVFKEFKAGTIGAVYQRLSSLEKKIDKILDRLEDRDHVEPKR